MRRLLLLFFCASCSAAEPSPSPAPPCEQTCQDEVAARSLREAMKLAYNLTLQGKPVGTHDETTPCPLGGRARVHGVATSNATQGTTDVALVYEFVECAYLQKSSAPKENYHVRITGLVSQQGVLAVQPTATTAMNLLSDDLRIDGVVHDPPSPVTVSCAFRAGQSGSRLSGTLCGRTFSVDL